MESYPFKEIEQKWRDKWDTDGTNIVDLEKTANKHYVLVMFSYPSEKKLHIGHWWNYGPTDTYARFKRMNGSNVFEPMGFDAFGLPAENYAIKHGVHPASTTRNSISFIREQLKFIGAMYDWSKEVNTSAPDYYHWTQWLFLQLYEAGKAYQKKGAVNWCPQCMTVLANEQVNDDGTCDRCKATVKTRDLTQWYLKITDYAEELLQGMDDIDWPESTKSRQRHWIGKSEGSEIVFDIKGSNKQITVFTTRPDTLFGVSYVVLAPENPLVTEITNAEHRKTVDRYIEEARSKSDIERLSTEHEKTGVFTGAYAVNPANGKEVPIWIADYVLASYGTGAVMAVPAHDQRDFEFASKFELPKIWVIAGKEKDEEIPNDHAFEDYGIMHGSGQFDGMTTEDGKVAVTEWLQEQGRGCATVTYRIRDWSISRQRYWGAPIPVVYCDKCGTVPVPEADLPVELPEEIEDFKPKGSSPLGAIDSFMNTKCPKCGENARRDPDTMDTFVDSSWYFLRYTSTDFDDRAFDKERVSNWLPVDTYVGGPEHATGHLIYSRFITKFLYSQGLIKFNEPFKRLIHQGIISQNGVRMSKSKGNVVNPDEFVDEYGADCFRLYLMFMGDYTVGGDWSDEGIVGIKRFQNRIWRLLEYLKSDINPNSELFIDKGVNRVLNHTIKEVTANLEDFQFNTAISRMMELVNELYHYVADEKRFNPAFFQDVIRKLTLILAPFAPHMCEELWRISGGKESVFDNKWPQHDENALKVDTVKIAVQVNGKLVEAIDVQKDCSQDEAVDAANEIDKISNRLSDKKIVKTIFVPNRILNFVVK